MGARPAAPAARRRGRARLARRSRRRRSRPRRAAVRADEQARAERILSESPTASCGRARAGCCGRCWGATCSGSRRSLRFAIGAHGKPALATGTATRWRSTCRTRGSWRCTRSAPARRSASTSRSRRRPFDELAVARDWLGAARGARASKRSSRQPTAGVPARVDSPRGGAEVPGRRLRRRAARADHKPWVCASSATWARPSPASSRLVFFASMSWSRLVYAVQRGRREARDVVLRHGSSDRNTIRKDVAVRFLRGDGIEIGALDFPLRLPRGARVRYVDHLDEAGLRSVHRDTLSAGRPLVS